MKKTIMLCLAMILLLGIASGALADDTVTLTFAETMTSPERTLVLQNAIEAPMKRPSIIVQVNSYVWWIGSTLKNTSSGTTSRYDCAIRTSEQMFLWLSMTPLLTPVVPDVNTMAAMSEALTLASR